MPVIPTYSQRTTAQGTPYRPANVPDFMSPALDKIGQGLMDVGRVTAEITTRKQKQADNLWLAKTVNSARTRMAKGLEDIRTTVTDEDYDASLATGVNPVTDKMHQFAMDLGKELREAAPTADAQASFDEHFSGLNASGIEKAMAAGAAGRTEYVIRTGDALAEENLKNIRTASSVDDARETALFSMEMNDIYVDGINAEPEIKAKVKDALNQKVRREYLRRFVLDAAARGEDPTEALNNAKDPVLQGLDANATYQAIEYAGSEMLKASRERDRATKAAKEDAETEMVRMNLDDAIDGKIDPDKMKAIGKVSPEALNQLLALQNQKLTELKEDDISAVAGTQLQAMSAQSRGVSLSDAIAEVTYAKGITTQTKRSLFAAVYTQYEKGHGKADSQVKDNIDAAFPSNAFGEKWNPVNEVKRGKVSTEYLFWRQGSGSDADAETAVKKGKELIDALERKTPPPKPPAPPEEFSRRALEFEMLRRKFEKGQVPRADYEAVERAWVNFYRDNDGKKP